MSRVSSVPTACVSRRFRLGALLLLMMAALGALRPREAAAAVNLLVNGSFENNTAAGTIFNPSNAVFNATVPSVTAYGVKEGIDIQTNGSGYGTNPQDGNWKV